MEVVAVAGAEEAKWKETWKVGFAIRATVAQPLAAPHQHKLHHLTTTGQPRPPYLEEPILSLPAYLESAYKVCQPNEPPAWILLADMPPYHGAQDISGSQPRPSASSPGMPAPPPGRANKLFRVLPQGYKQTYCKIPTVLSRFQQVPYPSERYLIYTANPVIMLFDEDIQLVHERRDAPQDRIC